MSSPRLKLRADLVSILISSNIVEIISDWGTSSVLLNSKTLTRHARSYLVSTDFK